MSFKMVSLWVVVALLVAATLKADPPQSEPAEIANQVKDQSKTHDGVIGEEHDVEKTILFQVRVYEIDHSGWAKEQGVEKRRHALDEVLRPWIGSSRGSKLERVNVKAWTVKELAPASEVEKLGNAVRLVSEPKLAVVEGHTGSFDYGGKTPQLRLLEVNGNGTSEGNSQVRPLATTFALEPDVTDAGRILLTVYFNPHGELRKKRSTRDELKKYGVKAAAELSVGQTLCLSDARPETSDNEDSLLVTITPYEIVSREVEKRIPPAATAPAKPKELEITVEDRWPIADIKVGQRVVAIPVTIEKTSLQADLTALAFGFDAKYSQRVTRIEPLPNQGGRRVTVSVPFNQYDEKSDRFQTIVENYLEGIRSSSSTFVIPTAMVSQTDLMSGRPVQELYAQIPIELRPRPVELTVGESFMAYGVAALMGSAKEGAHHEIGALSFDHLDDDGGGIWRATATKIGTARLIQLAVGSDMVGPARLTEYLVKADTRELELHIRQQFPSANVAITSIGANAVMLKGTVASDEDATGIVELAEQFAPKVLNRLKVGAAAIGSRTRESSDRSLTTSATHPHAVRQANGIADDAESQLTGERGGVSPPVERDRANDRGADPPRRTPLAESNVTEPQRVRPLKTGRGNSPKSEQLEQLRDEIRELRQDVRELIQRLDREPDTTLKNNDDAKPAVKLGRSDLDFNKLSLEFNELMEQQRFAEAEVIAKQAVELDPNNPLAVTMRMRAAFARRVATNEKQQPATTATSSSAAEPWLPAPLAHESVIANAWQMLGLRLAPLTESERKQLPSKFQGGMKVVEVRPDSPASQNKIRKDDILVGLHIWETTSFDNLQFVLGHPHILQHGTLKFYVLRGTETLFGELKIVTPAMPMPSNIRIDPPRQPRSIALSDLPNKLVTDFDKLKLHIEVHRALIDTALEARGITVTDEEAQQFLRLHGERDNIPYDIFQQTMKLTPMGQQFLQATRQQLALVKYSGQTTEPTEQELRDAYQLAQAGRVACRQLTFSDKTKAHEVARELHANPERFEAIAAKHGQPPNAHPGQTLIPTVPPDPQDEVLAKLKDGEISDVTQVGEQFVIYQRQRIVKPQGTFEQLKPQLRATLILNKTNEISQREIEKLRKEYRLIVVPAGATAAATDSRTFPSVLK